MTDTKWRSPTGHPIASDVTDKLPPKTCDFLTRGQDDVSKALDDLHKLAKFAHSTDDNIPFHHTGTINMLEARIERALAQQQPDVPRYDPRLGLIQKEPVNQAVLVALDRIEAVMCHEVCSSTNKQIAESGELCRSDISKIRSFLLRPVDLEELKKQEYNNFKQRVAQEQEEDGDKTKRAEQKGGE